MFIVDSRGGCVPVFDKIIISKYFPVLFTPARHWHPRPPIWECFSLLLSSFAPPLPNTYTHPHHCSPPLLPPPWWMVEINNSCCTVTSHRVNSGDVIDSHPHKNKCGAKKNNDTGLVPWRGRGVGGWRELRVGGCGTEGCWHVWLTAARPHVNVDVTSVIQGYAAPRGGGGGWGLGER